MTGVNTVKGHSGFATLEEPAKTLIATPALARQVTETILEALASGAERVEVHGMVLYTRKPDGALKQP